MKAGRASRTAEYMALFRALETKRPAGRRICEDRFAAAFLSTPLRLVVTLSRSRPVGALLRGYIDYQWPGARTSAVARTRFIDDVTADALASGGEQVDILGAGFDARAYRIAAMARVPIFEVDHPSTSAAKRSIVETVLVSIPQHVRLVPIDFNSQPLPNEMKAAGYNAERPTLFIWEGVTNYLSADAVDRTLCWCASAAGGSRVVFTYVHRHVLDTPEMFYGTRKLFGPCAARTSGGHSAWIRRACPPMLQNAASSSTKMLVLVSTVAGTLDARRLVCGATSSTGSQWHT
jgi:methyltransferase (TIGR00027 family)